MASKRKKVSKRVTNITATSSNHPISYGSPKSSLFTAYNPLFNVNMVQRMSMVATDLKSQREIKKLKADLAQKTDQYNYAVQISSSLEEENHTLKSQLKQAINAKIAIEQHLNEKIEYLTATITEYTQKYKDLQSKNEILESQNKYHQVRNTTHSLQYTMQVNECVTKQQEIATLTQKCHDEEEIIKHLRDQVQQLRKNERNLCKMLDASQQQLDDEMEQHLQTQRANEQQTAYLAATNANLEQQKRELEELLDQREDGIAMLKAQISFQEQRHSKLMQALTSQSLQFERSDLTDITGSRSTGKVTFM